ncbi:hypothetical protein MBRA_05055 [Methylobacterium brachiatum]|jgi:hypothetical protein|nr:hypothetical protein MBRA_05055 [Methylobacterium brachiatum]
MAKGPKNHGETWTPDNARALKDLAKGSTPSV